MMKNFFNFSETRADKWSEQLLFKLMQRTLRKNARKIMDFVDGLKRKYPTLDRERLAHKIISRRSIYAGGFGAVFGVGGVLTMPVSIPSDLLLSFRTQLLMVSAIAYTFGQNIQDEKIQVDLLMLVLGENLASNTMKELAKAAGEGFARKALQRRFSQAVAKRVYRRIFNRTQKSGLLKMAPLIGAPVGFIFDYAGTQAIGHTAIQYFKEKGQVQVKGQLREKVAV